MIVKLFDRTEIVVTKQQAENIAKMIEDDYKLIDINGNLIRPSAIAAIMQGGLTAADVRVDESHRIAAQHEITDEERAKNLERLAEIKRDFLRKRRERQAKEK